MCTKEEIGHGDFFQLTIDNGQLDMRYEVFVSHKGHKGSQSTQRMFEV